MAGTEEQPGPAAPARASRRKGRGYLVPGLIALAVLGVVAVVVNAAGLQHRDPTALAGPDVATRIAQSIQARNALPTPPQVRCPASTPVRGGLVFTCRLTAGPGRDITVTQTDGRGSYTWSVATH